MSVERGVSAQYFSLRWNNHPANLVSVFSGLYTSETLVDVTLAAQGRHLQAHKMLLSACSEYFQALFAVNPCQHPIVILKDVNFDDLQMVVQFMYHGVVNVASDKLAAVLKTADMLQIKGLGEKFSESVNQFMSGHNNGNSSRSNSLNSGVHKNLAKVNSASPRLLSVPSQHSVSSSIRQHSTESLPAELIHRQGSSESRQASLESSASTSHAMTTRPGESTSPPPNHLRKKFRRISCEQRSSGSPPIIHVSRQSSSSTDPGTQPTQPSSTVVAKKKRELFSARSSRSGGSNRSSCSDYGLGLKRESSGSSNQSHSISQSQEEATSTTTAVSTGTIASASTSNVATLTVPTEKSGRIMPKIGTNETATDLSPTRASSGNKRARFLGDRTAWKKELT